MAQLRWLGAGLLLALLASAPAQTSSSKDKGSTAKKNDVQLVERLLAARKEYQVSLETLRAHYIAAHDIEKARWAEEELLQFHRIAKQAYNLGLDVPPPTLSASYNIPEANELFRRAVGFKAKGWGGDYTDNQIRAEHLFQKMLTNHPQSDKISDAAYHLGDIYESRAYKQYARAAQYFERCYQWNPKTHFDARMRAARLYDKTLNDRAKAIDLYKLVTTHETDDKRIEEARKRLAELGSKR
jgi:TolA-binding protein